MVIIADLLHFHSGVETPSFPPIAENDEKISEIFLTTSAIDRESFLLLLDERFLLNENLFAE